MGIDPPAEPQAADPPQIVPAQQPQAPEPDILAPPPAPVLPAPDTTRPVKNEEVPRGDRRSSQSGQDRKGALVTMMTIDLDAKRIALSSPEGPPVRGDVSTDLERGFYTVQPDTGRQEWVFMAGQVKPGLRFRVGLDGLTPFDLTYPPSLPLIVQRGFQPTGAETFRAVKARVSQAVSDLQYGDAFGILDLLGEVDLYDVVDELWLDEPGVVNALLLKFGEGLKAKQYDMFRILRALETFAVDRKKLYVDAFDKCLVHPTTWEKDEVRQKLGKTNIKLVFTYALMPERGVIIFADDVSDSQWKADEPWQYGEGCLLYPRHCTAATTPRMQAAKKQKIQEIQAQNFEFIKTAWGAVEHVLSFSVMASGLMLRTLPEVAASPRPARPITDAFENQPGKWAPDFEASANMSEEAAAYQSRVCHADEGWGYYRNGVQFDGYEQRTLIDAKYYPDGSGMAKSLARNNVWAGNRALDQAMRQLKAAGGMPVEWRVAGQTATAKLQELFRVNNVPIKVVCVL